MDKTQHKLLTLLRGALWGTNCDAVTVEELRQVLELAKVHTVKGLVTGLFMDNKVQVKDSPEKEDEMMNLAANDAIHKRTYAKHSGVVAELDSLMTANHIAYFVFKGTAAASHYSKPYRRTMGDVDFYVPKYMFDKAIDVLTNQWNVKVDSGESEKHMSFSYKNVSFELHHRVETFGSCKHQRLYDQWINEGLAHSVDYEVAGGSARMLSPVEDIITVFKHMFNHLLVEGVGLRQVVDVAVLLNDYQDAVDAESLRERLSMIGYIKAFDATVAMLNDFLGLPCASRYAGLTERNSQWGRKMMEFVLKSGNFGRNAYKNKSAGLARSGETAGRAFHHIFSLAPLIPSETPGIIARHTAITLRKYFGKSFIHYDESNNHNFLL